MRMFRECFYVLVAVFTVFFVAGCGSSDGDGRPQALTGKFIDSAVQGVNYRTATQSGVTNAAGEFRYLSGETITFSIGDISLPPAAASSVVTPYDLAGSGSGSGESVVNIARFLQTLDEDGDPDNGIQVGEDAHTAAEGVSVSFSSPTFDEDVDPVIEAVGGSGAELVDEAAAIAHLEQTMNGSLVGLWNVYLNGSSQAEGTFRIELIGDALAISCECGQFTEGSVSIDGTVVDIEMIDGNYTPSEVAAITGTLSANTITGTYTYTDTEGEVDGGSFRAVLGTEVLCDNEGTGRVNAECFLVHFSNDQYWQEMVVEDPQAIVDHIDISGYNVTDESMVYGLYEHKPTEWWTSPNIFISEGSEPEYPINHTMIIYYKDGTSERRDFTTTGYEEAQ